MTTLTFDETGARYYETGVSKGILFLQDGSTPGVPWNGLVSVGLDPSGGEPEHYYYDGMKYMDRVLAEEFQATVQAISTPPEFERCEGVREYAPGVKTAFNKRDKFTMVWRTEIGSDEGASVAYKLHIAYNCLVQPSGRNYQTVSDNQTMDIRSFTITTTPACGRHSYFWFDSRAYDLALLEAELYQGNLPYCWELKDLVNVAGSDPDAPPDPTDDTGCVSFLEDYEEYEFGETVDETKTSVISPIDATTIVWGVINNGLEITELPATGAFAANDSAASEVGTGDILADDDDATYITSADGDLGYTIGLPSLVGYREGAEFELHIRMSVSGGVNPDDPDNRDADAQVHISTDAAGDLTIGGFSDGANEGMGFTIEAVDGAPVDYVVPLSMDAWIDTELSDVVTALETGAYLNVRAVSNNNPDTTPVVEVYEASVVMLDATDSDKFLRLEPVSAYGQLETHMYVSGTTDDVQEAYTTTVDFKFLEIPFDATADGRLWAVLDWSDIVTHPAWLFANLDGDVPILQITDEPGDTVLEDFYPDTNTWYIASAYWTWGSVRITVANRDEPKVLLMDTTVLTDYIPTATLRNNAGKLGSSAKTYELVIDNTRIQMHCNEVGPSSGGTTFLHPGTLTWELAGPNPPWDTGVMTGALPLQDSDDATYIGIETDSDGFDVTYINRAVGPVYETYSGSPSSFTVHMRASISTTDPLGALVSIAITDATDDSPTVILSPSTFSWALADTGGVITDFTLVMTDADFTYWGTTMSAIAALIASGNAKFVIQNNISTSGTACSTYVHMYKLELELT